MNNPPFEVGDLVTSSYYEAEKEVVRRVTSIEKAPRAEGGWIASVDGGDPCPNCGMNGHEIYGVSIRWLKPAGEKP